MVNRSIKAVSTLLAASIVFSGLVFYRTPVDAAALNIDSTFPDANFRAHIKATYDEDGDGYLSDTERRSVWELDVSDKGIKSLKGIENFSFMLSLFADGNELEEVDLTSNVSLQRINLTNNKITSVKIPDELDSLVAIALDGNRLTSFNLKGKYPQLKIINFANNNLNSFSMEISGTPTEITNNDQLDSTLKLNGNPSLSQINGSPLFPLKTLNISNTNISYVDPSLLTELHEFNFSNSPYSDTSNLPSTLWFLYCNNSGITSLDCSQMTELANLECSGNSLTYLDLSNTEVTYLDCSNNELTDLILPSRRGGTFDCSGNRLTELTTKAAILNCSNNLLTKLTIGTNIQKLYASDNSLTSFELRGDKLTEADLSNNDLQKLNIIRAPKLVTVDVSGNDNLSAGAITGSYSCEIVGVGEDPTPTPTNTATPTPTNTVMPTNTATPTPTNTVTPTNTATPTPTNTVTPTNTATPTPTNTVTPTNTATPMPTNTVTPTNTATPMPTNTVTPTNTATPMPTNTVAATDTATPTPTNTVAATDTATPTPTNTAAPTDTATPTATNTAAPTDTAVATVTAAPSNTAAPLKPTLTPLPSLRKPTITTMAKATATAAPINTISAGYEPTKAPTVTPSGRTYAVLEEPTSAPEVTYSMTEAAVTGSAAPAVRQDLEFSLAGNGYVIVSVDSVAFNSASDAASIVVPDRVVYSGKSYKVVSIADKAFKGRKKLKKVKIGKNIETIGKEAFAGCASLKKITIPAAVKKIGASAFSGDKKLSSITIKSKKLTSKSVGKKAFKGISAKAVFKVNKSKLKVYKAFFKKKGIPSKTVIK